ncbi:MAG TPA: aspartate-semialdehyde dehydrogenase [Chlamydiales bacterium]|nr:aspartate-semialdehyde dehydrogenase [Chlamydiales bacterium]
MEKISVGIFGASGLVGKEIIQLLESHNNLDIHFFTSENSLNQEVKFQNQTYYYALPNENEIKNLNIAFFAASSEISKKWIPFCTKHGIYCIDNSSAFRTDDTVPLIIPEINQEKIKKSLLIASPNCTTTLMALALFPLQEQFGLKRVYASTYQAASGGGKALMQKLFTNTHSQLNQFSTDDINSYGFNLFLHSWPHDENLYSEEETKIIFETKKILQTPSLPINVTCVRVPSLRAHAIALNIELLNDSSIDQVKLALDQFEGIEAYPDKANEFATPLFATGKKPIFYSRLRKDLSKKNSYDLWIVGDQLLKGAALNAYQVFISILSQNFIKASYSNSSS